MKFNAKTEIWDLSRKPFWPSPKLLAMARPFFSTRRRKYLFLVSLVGLAWLLVLRTYVANQTSLICRGVTPLTEALRFLLNSTESSPQRPTPPDRQGLRTAIERGSAPPLLTLFSTWGDSRDKEHVRKLTLRNWQQLQPFVRPVLFSNSSALRAQAEAWGWSVLPVTSAALGIPLLKNMYRDVMGRFNSSLYAFANGDILFSDSLVDTLLAVLSSPSFPGRDSPHAWMLTGTRTNVANVSTREADRLADVVAVAGDRGELFIPEAQDYFITDRTFPWAAVPDFVVGRIAYDSWLTSSAVVSQDIHLIDGTDTLLAVHQTTAAGNKEGFSHTDANYNWDRLRDERPFKQLLHQNLHSTYCSAWKTERASAPNTGVINVVRRTRHQLELGGCQLCVKDLTSVP